MPSDRDQSNLTAREDGADQFEDEVDEGEGEVEAEGVEGAPAAAAPGGGEPAGEDGGAQVIRLGAPAEPDLASEFPALVQSVFAESGSASTGESYAGHLKRFFSWAVARGFNLKTMPPDTAGKYLEESYPNPATRSQAAVALRSCFDLGVTRGVPVARQEVPRIAKPKKVKPAQAVNGHPGTNGHTNGSEVPTVSAHSLFTDTATGPEVPATRVAQPAQRESITQPRAQPAAPNRRGAGVLPSLGQRIRISKRATGSEGLGVPTGTLILVGDFSAQDIESEGRLEAFIANQIRPSYGPFAGQRACTYMVDRLDNLGNPIPGATLSVPIMPAPGEAPAGLVPPPQMQGQAQPQGQPQSSVTGDKMLDYILSEQRRREGEYERRIAEIKEQATAKGLDPTMLMLLLDRVKPEPLDVSKLIAEFKKANPEPEPEPLTRRERGMRGGPAAVHDPMGLGGLDGLDFGSMPTPPPEPAKPDATVEILGKMMEQQNTLLTTLLTRTLNPPPPAPAPPQRDPLEMALTLVKLINDKPAPAPVQEDPLKQTLINLAIANLTKPPEKPKSVAETITEINALREAAELFSSGPEEKPLTVMDVLANVVENAPKIGEAIGTVLSAMPKAPTLPRPGQPTQRALPPHAQAQAAAPPQPKAAPMPKEAQEAFLVLKDATDEQVIADSLFAILTAYGTGGDPWPLATKRLIADFQKCDTKAEIRGLVTNLFVLSGAKRLMSDANVERIATVLHTHYPLLYAQMTGGQEKHLKDEVKPVDPVTTEAPAEVAATTAPAAPPETPPAEVVYEEVKEVAAVV